jgi:hypothetical protein
MLSVGMLVLVLVVGVAIYRTLISRRGTGPFGSHTT